MLYKFAVWADVFAKAKRLKDDGRVIIQRNGYDNVVAMVRGDYGVYEVEYQRQDPGSRSITMWSCTCPWAQFVWFRTGPWKKYEGRVCSHCLAAYWAAKGTPLDEDAIEQYEMQEELGQRVETPLDDILPEGEEGPPGGPGADMLEGPEEDLPDELDEILPEELPVEPDLAQGPLPTQPELPFKPQGELVEPTSEKGEMTQPNPIEQGLLELQKQLGPETFNFYQQKYPQFFKLPGSLSHTAARERGVGDRCFFEYHCFESNESQDAELWHRSHQPVTIVSGPHWDESGERYPTSAARAEAGMPDWYRVRWPDGYEHDAMEDELMDSASEYQRPAPPRTAAGGDDFDVIWDMLYPAPGKNAQSPTGQMLKDESGEYRGGVNPHPEAKPLRYRQDNSPIYDLDDMGWHPTEGQMYTQDRVHQVPERRGDYGTIPAGAKVSIQDADKTTGWVLVNWPVEDTSYCQHRMIEAWVEAKNVKLIGSERLGPFIKRRGPAPVEEEWNTGNASDDWA